MHEIGKDTHRMRQDSPIEFKIVPVYTLQYSINQTVDMNDEFFFGKHGGTSCGIGEYR